MDLIEKLNQDIFNLTIQIEGLIGSRHYARDLLKQLVRIKNQKNRKLK